MIFYLSGTGNSFYVAEKIANSINERLVSIATIMMGKSGYDFTLEENETIGFVYPVYAWAPPQMVLNFIKNMNIKNYKNNLVFSVATCGGNVGNTMKKLSGILMEKQLQLDNGFSIQMPNNYVIMGNVDSKETAEKKLIDADKKIEIICEIVKRREKGGFMLEKGLWPFAMTTIVSPLFNKNAIKPEKFYALDSCTACGICEKVCNCNNITVDKKPSWGKNCIQCLACLHYCPVKAVQFGKGTERKGRYHNPKVKLEKMFIKKL